ncbi:sulfotransferase family 2 domain-containing protein [Pseudopelagicola sp. nBUS_19]|uniref:sulfotransferase family 2 domain-containing protein n=1 Tax=Pseudopelagicola sp. nBUS_19 TaxID=3395316 RepID=UPI003EBE128B
MMIFSSRKYRNIVKQIFLRCRTLDFYFGQRAILDKDLKLIYIPLPKCANSHVKKALLASRQTRNEFRVHDPRNFSWLHPRKITQYAQSGEYHIFCIIREPRERIFSAYKNKVLDQSATFLPVRDLGLSQGDTIGKFVQAIITWPKMLLNDHFKPQIDLLKGYNFNEIKFYSLENQIDMLTLEKKLTSHGCHIDLLQRTNRSSNTNIFVTAETENKLSHFLKEDFDFYISMQKKSDI